MLKRPLAAERGLAAQSPSQPDTHRRLGEALFAAAGFGAALHSLRRASWLAPQSVDAQINLGIALVELGRFHEARMPFRRALCLQPHEPDTHHGMGVIDNEAGRLIEAERRLRRALSARPANVETLTRLAGVLVRLGRFDEAAPIERKVLALDPGRAAAQIDLALILIRQAKHRAALGCCLRASAIDPESVQALVNGAGALAAIGRALDAAAMLRRAADIGQAGANPFRYLLAVMSYAVIDQETRWETAREFSRRYAAPRSTPSFANSRDARRRLTVGYLSSDFYEHPVARNLLPIIEAHDRRALQVLCYSDAGVIDETTRRVQAAAAGWRSTGGLADAEVARQIREDVVDVLVISGGRFDKNRPLVASFRAAPVQISLFDGGTSGLDDMDYLLADPALVPRAGRERFTERVIRLPSLYVHAPVLDAAPVAEPPCLASGHVTFGCFNNPAKLSDETLAVWAALLRAIPTARLRLKYHGVYRDSDLQLRILSGLGVGRDRIDFLWSADLTVAHLGHYGGVDIAIDTFPFTGSTTTWEALWMGVPVVTLLGDALVGRLSASFLKPVGLGALIAKTPADYVRIAKDLAGDPTRLATLRASLRDRVARSPLCNGPARARQLERVYRATWRRWCEGP